jgi:cellulose synthase/poly-beta-1,6-N-acetylglucosamine synthase-like glycosyltransferase
MHTLRLIFDTTFVGYLMALNLAYTALLLLGSRQVSEWVRRRPLRDFRGVSRSELSLPVTILAPAYNEEPVIVPSIRSLLASHYRELQVMVINDGSTDGTLWRHKRMFLNPRYPGWRDLRRLMVAAVVENFGYRRWLAIVRTKALWTVLRPETGWGEMTRLGFSEPVPAVAPGISSHFDG